MQLISIEDGKESVVLTMEEASEISSFIRYSLEQEWDRYTDNFICKDKYEDGVKRMNPKIYNLQEELSKLGAC